MDKTALEILHEKAPATKSNVLRELVADPELFTADLIKAMQAFAEQEAKAYASWLSNTVIAGRTASKLWTDYKAEIK